MPFFEACPCRSMYINNSLDDVVSVVLDESVESGTIGFEAAVLRRLVMRN